MRKHAGFLTDEERAITPSESYYKGGKNDRQK